jgi:hypothetical protein
MSVIHRVVDPKRFVSAPTPDPDPVSDPAMLVSASRKLHGNYSIPMFL